MKWSHPTCCPHPIIFVPIPAPNNLHIVNCNILLTNVLKLMCWKSITFALRKLPQVKDTEPIKHHKCTADSRVTVGCVKRSSKYFLALLTFVPITTVLSRMLSLLLWEYHKFWTHYCCNTANFIPIPTVILLPCYSLQGTIDLRLELILDLDPSSFSQKCDIIIPLQKISRAFIHNILTNPIHRGKDAETDNTERCADTHTQYLPNFVGRGKIQDN